MAIVAAIGSMSSSAKENDAPPPLEDHMAAIDASATASSSHMAAIDASATASSSADAPAPLERFEATVVRWRRLGKRFVFMDVRRDGSAEEWQLSCDANTFAGAERAAVVRVARARRANPSARPPGPALRGRGDAFATDGERRWSEGAKLRRLAELKREGDARDPWAERAEGASRATRTRISTTPRSARAARHSEFATWLLDTFGRATLEQGPILDVAGGKGALAWELQRTSRATRTSATTSSKDAGVGMGFLRCVGKNKVIYRATAAAPRPDVVLAQPEDPLYLPAGARLERQRTPRPLHRPRAGG
ncbi:hypothetical protein SO694_00031311 [Aureococcus anophagefferens]|uniref:Uncharacterized protein n=1 Tax=Aureococcus anophagefferens TaxID=44056 RepID=A0ABR1FJP8_AURAN